MLVSPLTKRALYFSAEAHDGQYRKGGKVPYVVHSVLVASVVSKYSKDERVVCAALLHDVLEDCPSVHPDGLEDLFGADILNLVKEVSFLEEDENLSWKEKKLKYLERMRRLSQDALLIIAADKMVNLSAYFENVKSDPEKVKALFKGTQEEYSWYYEEVGKILGQLLSCEEAIADYSRILKENRGL